MRPRGICDKALTMGLTCYNSIHMTEPPETSELLAFATTVEARSLSKAAAQLGAPRATIGRRLARLESRLGARLLRRTTRSLVLTDAGEAFYRHARIVLDAVRTAEASVRRTDDRVRGDLRVSVPPIMSESFFSLIGAFAAQYADLRVHVHFSTEHVDLQRGGFDVAIRAGSVLEPGLVARTLARMPLFAVASPAYLEAHGTPRTARDLRGHRCLMGFAKGETPMTHWPRKGGGLIQVAGAFFSNEITLLRTLAVQNLGIAVLPLSLTLPDLESGALVPVLHGVIEGEGKVVAAYAEREFVPPQVRAFIDFVVPWAARELPQTVPESCRDRGDVANRRTREKRLATGAKRLHR